MIELLKSKIHRATITDAQIHYVGSITISKNILGKVSIREYEKVLVVDINNAHRFETYVIATDEENTICVNGAAARLVAVGDIVIIMAFQYLDETKIPKNYKPNILVMGTDNTISEHFPSELIIEK